MYSLVVARRYETGGWCIFHGNISVVFTVFRFSTGEVFIKMYPKPIFAIVNNCPTLNLNTF
jgi:hypothetical protein